ncbi:MAG: 50S ribosomal protein L18e [archaeon]
MKAGTTNPKLKKLIVELKKSKKPIWLSVAEKLERPRRKNAGVNVWKLNSFTKEGDVVVVPGKVLAEGEMDHGITVAALSFSKAAADKIKKKGSVMTIRELMDKNAKGTKITILQ